MPEDDALADIMAQERAEREQGIREASQTLERIARQAAQYKAHRGPM